MSDKTQNSLENIIDILACPICKGKLNYNAEKKELICNFDKLAYPIRKNIPIMIAKEAIDLKKRKNNHD